MKKIQRTIALLLVLSLLFITPTFAQNSVVAEQETDSSAEIIHKSTRYTDQLSAFGITDEIQYEASDYVTRGELAALACTLLGIPSNELTNSTETTFMDIGESPYKAHIQTLANMRILSGVSAQQFMPDAVCSYAAAVKVLVSVLGYVPMAEAKGGFPSGYMAIATELKILPDKVADSSRITWEELAEMVVNSFDVPVLTISQIGEQISYTKSDDMTILTEYLNIECVQGVITDNGITMINGDSKIDEDCVKIGDVIIRKGNTDIESKIGRSVKCYYTTETIVNTALYYENARSGNTVTIKAADISNVTKTQLTYKDGTHYKKIDISKYADFIYNGTSYPDFDVAEMQISNGSLTFCETNSLDSGFDLIIAEEYETLIVSSVNLDRNIIYGRYGEVLMLENYDSANIYNESGTKLLLSEVLKDYVVSYFESKNGKSIRCVVSIESLIGRLNVITTTGTETLYTIGETEYKLSSTLAGLYNVSAVALPKIKFGGEYKIYLDIENCIAGIEGDITGEYYAYATDMWKGESFSDRNSAYLSLFLETGEFTDVKTAKKILINKASEKQNGVELLDVAELYDEGNFKPQLVKVLINADGELKEIETASTTKNSYGYNTDRFSMDFSASNAYYRVGSKVMGSYAILPSAPVFKVPENFDESKFEVMTPASLLTASYNAELYDFDPSLCAQAAVIKVKVDEPMYQNAMFVVEDAKKVLNEDDEWVWRMTGYYSNGYWELTEKEEGIIDATAPNGVSSGDVLRVEIKADGSAFNKVITAAQYVASLAEITTPEIFYYKGESAATYYTLCGPMYAKSAGGISVLYDGVNNLLKTINPYSTATYLSYNVETEELRKITYEEIMTQTVVFGDGSADFDRYNLLFCQVADTYLQLAVVLEVN